jgi:hypothetical protein
MYWDREYSFPLLVLALLLVLVLLSGCVTNGPGSSTTLQPVCDALIGPIKYNSTNPKSARHAGKALVPDLRERNQVGRNLGCAQYR